MSSSTVQNKNQKLFKIGWKTRHLVILLVAVMGTYGFEESRASWAEMHRWNRAFGDMSVLMVAATMAIGPLGRLWKVCQSAYLWRRELGIYSVILMIIHTVIILMGWVEWDFYRLFGYEYVPQMFSYVMALQGFGLANAIGIIALVYGIVLALASNDWSQKWLGGSAWKFLQQGSYVLWMLVVVHTAYFLYLHFQDYHRRIPDPNWAQIPFIVLVGLVTALQLAAFFKTWKARRLQKTDRMTKA